MSLIVKNPTPNFDEFRNVLVGSKKPEKVHIIELSVDREVMEYIITHFLGEKFPYSDAERVKIQKLHDFTLGGKIIVTDNDTERMYYKQYINFYHSLGYDCFTDIRPFRYLTSLIMPKVRTTTDTALLPRKGGYYSTEILESSREWVEESYGVITSWHDFENFPWHRMKLELDLHYEFIQQNLPEGMKVMVSGSLFEVVLERLLVS